MTTDFHALLDVFRTHLEAELASWLAERRRDAAGYLGEELVVIDTIERLLGAGGKRLRPALVYFSYKSCGGETEASVLPLALATELLHTYLLIHDDIMDRAASRRGQPSAHRWFADRHRHHGWAGDGEHYGRSMAIHAGDLAHTWADQLVAGIEVEPGLRLELQRTYFAMCREVIDGQYLEMHLGFREPSETELAQVLRLKSGLYSVERPIQLGAVMAMAGERRRSGLGRYGRALGEAFQLRDDILGLFGDSTEVGKPVGDDLREGKFTFLIHHTLERASEAEAQRVRGALGQAHLEASEVEAVSRIVRESGGLEAVETMIERRSREALEALDGLDLTPAGRAFFLGLVDYVARRNH